MSFRTLVLLGSGVALAAFNASCPASVAESLKPSVLGAERRAFPAPVPTNSAVPASRSTRPGTIAGQATSTTYPLDLRKLSMADFGDLEQGR